MQPTVKAFFDAATSSLTYVVSDPATKRAAVIDPALDFDPASGRTGTSGPDAVIAHVRGEGLTVDWILETHVHADHLSASPHLKEYLGGRTAIGRNVTVVQDLFKRLFNLEEDFAVDGRQFDHLFEEGERFSIGGIAAEAWHTPGHTPACLTYVVGDAAFVGDTLFMPDYGTARCDFPKGDAATLYRSIRRILSLPPETRLFMCHDYLPGGRDLRFETSVAEERADNIHIRDGVSEADFVRRRVERDRTLAMPRLILPSVQVNIRAGHLPPPESNGVSYLKLPLDVF